MALSLESWVFVLRIVEARDAWASCITALLHARLALQHGRLAFMAYAIALLHSPALCCLYTSPASLAFFSLTLYLSIPPIPPPTSTKKNADDKISRDARGVGSAAHTLNPPLLRRGHTNDAGRARARDACNQHTDSGTLHSILGVRFRSPVTPAAEGDTCIRGHMHIATTRESARGIVDMVKGQCCRENWSHGRP